MLGPPTPCVPWITEDDLDPCCAVPDGLDPAVVTSAVTAAVEYLYDATCRRWPGECSAIVRPCLPCRCRVECRCRYTRIALEAPYPITGITEVLVEGVALAATDYRLDNNRDLVLQQPNTLGITCWPIQVLDAVDDAADTWSVEYTFGPSPIELAKTAAVDLACELIKACAGEECMLPDGVTSVTRQGVTFVLRGPETGLTNVKTADLLIAQYGKCGGRRQFVDPDQPLTAYRGPGGP